MLKVSAHISFSTVAMRKERRDKRNSKACIQYHDTLTESHCQKWFCKPTIKKVVSSLCQIICPRTKIA